MPETPKTEVSVVVDSKPWYESQTVWGSILKGVALILAIFGVSIPDDQLASGSAVLVQAVSGVMGLVGFAIEMWGRGKATKPIHFVAPRSEIVTARRA